MPEPAKKIKEAREKVIEAAMRPRLDFSAWREDFFKREAEEKARTEAEAIANAKVGDIMPDGAIYAGISPNTNERMYVTAKDASLLMDFNAAAKYAKNLDEHGHKDWRVPTKEELNVLFQNRNKGALRGTFNTTGLYPVIYYRSSTTDEDNRKWGQRFNDGLQHMHGGDYHSSVRCVR